MQLKCLYSSILEEFTVQYVEYSFTRLEICRG